MAEKGSMNGQSIPAPQDYRTFHGEQNVQTTYPSLPAYSMGPMGQTPIPINDEPTNQSSGCCGGPLPVSNADQAEMEDYYKIKPPLQVREIVSTSTLYRRKCYNCVFSVIFSVFAWNALCPSVILG